MRTGKCVNLLLVSVLLRTLILRCDDFFIVNQGDRLPIVKSFPFLVMSLKKSYKTKPFGL